jgi:Protein of unknown function (DUF2786)
LSSLDKLIAGAMLDHVKLSKVLALADSSNAGEAAAAIATAQRILAKSGKSLADLAQAFAAISGDMSIGAAAAAPGAHETRSSTAPNPSAAQEAEAAASCGTSEAKQRPTSPFAASFGAAPPLTVEEVLARYGGSMEAALAPCTREKLLRTSVARWAHIAEPPMERWTLSLDGWTGSDPEVPLPNRIREAVENAYSLPTSVIGALAEWHYWQRRRQELTALHPLTPHPPCGLTARGLDVPAQARANVIQKLAESELRAQTARDALARAEHWQEQAATNGLSAIENALIDDLRHLAVREAETADQDRRAHLKPSHFRTASERREEVMRTLATAEGYALSDREIARRVGVSPQTVGNLRRRVDDPYIVPV